MAKIPHSKIKKKITEFAALKVIYFENVAQFSRSIKLDVFVDNMKRNFDLQNTWSSCVTANSCDRGFKSDFIH